MSNYITGLVSVVVVTYNHEKFIDETIESIVGQTYPHLEILVCDDHSKDRTAEKILEWAVKDKRVVPLLSEKNEGLSINVNKGFDRATGEFLAIIGGDDIMLPLKIEEQAGFLNKNKDYDAVIHHVEAFDSDTKAVLFSQTSNFISSPDQWFFGQTWIRLFKTKNSTFPTNSTFFARSVYALQARFDPRLKYKNEILYFIDMYMQNPAAKWAVLPHIFSRYRIHKSNMHQSESMKNRLLEETYINYAIAIAKYPQLSRKLKSNLTYFLFRHLSYHLYNPNANAKETQYLKTRLRTEAGFFLYSFAMLVITCNLMKNKLSLLNRKSFATQNP